MNVTIKRLDPNLPDPVESRRRAAGRFVRFALRRDRIRRARFLHRLFRRLRAPLIEFRRQAARQQLWTPE